MVQIYSHKSFFVENGRIVWKVKTTGGSHFSLNHDSWRKRKSSSEQNPNHNTPRFSSASPLLWRWYTFEVQHVDTEHDGFERVEIYIYIYTFWLIIFCIHTHSSLQNIASLVYPNPPPLHAPPDWYQLGRHEYRSLRCQACSKDWIRGRIGDDQTGQCSFLLGKELYNLRKKQCQPYFHRVNFVVGKNESRCKRVAVLRM